MCNNTTPGYKCICCIPPNHTIPYHIHTPPYRFHVPYASTHHTEPCHPRKMQHIISVSQKVIEQHLEQVC